MLFVDVYVAAYPGQRAAGLTWIGGDVHVYEEHLALALKVIEQTPKEAPALVYEPKADDVFRADDFRLDGAYEPSLTDRASMVV